MNQNFELEKKTSKCVDANNVEVANMQRSISYSKLMREASNVSFHSRRVALQGDGNGDGDGDVDVDEEVLTPASSLTGIKLHIMQQQQQQEEEVEDDCRSLDSKTGTIKIENERHGFGKKLKEELSKYKQELKEYNDTTKDLEEKYMKINLELSEMQQRHDVFVSNHNRNAIAASDTSNYDSSTSVGSDVYVKRKQVKAQDEGLYQRHNSFMTVLTTRASNEDLQEQAYNKQCQQLNKRAAGGGGTYSRTHGERRATGGGNVSTASCHDRPRHHIRRASADQENHPPARESNAFNEVFNVLKDVINTTQQKPRQVQDSAGSDGVNQLYSTISNLKNEHMQYRYIIQQQQDCISDYQTRCVKAQEIMQTQKQEIEKLNVNNRQLETSIYEDFDELRFKINAKLQTVSHLPQLMRDEHIKYEKAVHENCLLKEKLNSLQTEAQQLKVKIDELGKRKLLTINRLKAAERDLKIFKNYNTALKMEKRRLSDELCKVRNQLEALQTVNKRQMARHREQSEKQRRELQKRVFDLELKLGRSQNSTTSLIQERDSLIAELQTQLHTLVHNFEVSQKHIRVLRRHIYTMTSGNGGPNGTNGGSAGNLIGNSNSVSVARNSCPIGSTAALSGGQLSSRSVKSAPHASSNCPGSSIMRMGGNARAMKSPRQTKI